MRLTDITPDFTIPSSVAGEPPLAAVYLPTSSQVNSPIYVETLGFPSAQAVVPVTTAQPDTLPFLREKGAVIYTGAGTLVDSDLLKYSLEAALQCLGSQGIRRDGRPLLGLGVSAGTISWFGARWRGLIGTVGDDAVIKLDALGFMSPAGIHGRIKPNDQALLAIPGMTSVYPMLLKLQANLPGSGQNYRASLDTIGIRRTPTSLLTQMLKTLLAAQPTLEQEVEAREWGYGPRVRFFISKTDKVTVGHRDLIGDGNNVVDFQIPDDPKGHYSPAAAARAFAALADMARNS